MASPVRSAQGCTIFVPDDIPSPTADVAGLDQSIPVCDRRHLEKSQAQSIDQRPRTTQILYGETLSQIGLIRTDAHNNCDRRTRFHLRAGTGLKVESLDIRDAIGFIAMKSPFPYCLLRTH
jgi:hypothetical protein